MACWTSMRGPDRDAGALGALGELAARGVLVAPARLGQHEDGARRAARWSSAPSSRLGAGAGVDDLELRRPRAPTSSPSSSIGSATSPASRRPARTASASWTEFSPTTRMATCGWRRAKSSTSPGSRRWWAVLNVPSDAVPPVSVRARRTTSAASPAAASVRSASGRSSRPASVSSSRRPGAHEQRDAELGLEVARSARRRSGGRGAGRRPRR